MVAAVAEGGKVAMAQEQFMTRSCGLVSVSDVVVSEGRGTKRWRKGLVGCVDCKEESWRRSAII